MGKVLDSFERWEQQGLLKDKLELIAKLVSKGYTNENIAKSLGISGKTLQKLKNKHVEFASAFNKGESELKETLLNSIYKKAIGYEYEETQQVYEENSGKPKKKVIKVKKYAQPCLTSARYLLIIKFGRDFNEKKDEISIMEKRVLNNNEIWNSEAILEDDMKDKD